MANRVALSISLCIWLCNAISVVLAADGCKTHNDCKYLFWWKRSCCLNTFGEKRCVFGTCENDYCRTDNDCANSALCCRSKKCVKNGCSGCSKNTDCQDHRYCCKKTYPFSQTFCASNCINASCSSNEDCGGPFECCRYGKCAITGCKCTSNSNCDFDEYCCKKRRWGYGCSKSCVGEICSSDDDCGGPNECCISNKCVTSGCHGCTKNKHCATFHHCCKKTFPWRETFCASNCVNQPCNSNDDCGGPFECCRSGKCSRTGCYDRCTSNSECHLGEFCCKKRRTWGDGCSKSCVGSFCTSVDDCGGPNECCVSNKCVTSDCDFGKCSADCIGKSCATSKDCGDLGEICNSHNICEPRVRTAYPTPYPFISTAPYPFISTTPYPVHTPKSRNSSRSSFPMWVIVVVVSLFILLISLAMAMICHFKRKRSAPATQVIRGTMDLQNTTNYAEVNPGMQGTGFPSPPPPYESVAQENPRNHRAAIQNTRQQFSENPPPYSEIDAFQNFHHQGNQLAMPSNAYHYESEGCVVPNNPSQSPIFLNAQYPTDSHQRGSPPP